MSQLSKLEFFTAFAMQGFAANPETWHESDAEIARVAISLAETTLEKLDAKSKPEEDD